MYKIVVSPKAKNQLRKISKRLYRDSIAQAIEELKFNPFVGKPLARELTGKYSYRIGTYRVIYKIRHKDNIVEVILAGHRATIYN